MSKGKVIILGSNATRIETKGGRWGSTGQYLNETVVPAMALLDAGYEVVLATPNGEKPHIDTASDAPEHFGGDRAAHARGQAFYAKDPSMNARTLRSVIDEGLDNYAAVFGQAVRRRLSTSCRTRTSATSCVTSMSRETDGAALSWPDIRCCRDALCSRVPVGAHRRRSGQGGGVGEGLAVLHAKIYFDMPFALSTAGGHVTTTPRDFEPYVVEDRELITGQNPRSAHPIAAALIAALDRKRAAA